MYLGIRTVIYPVSDLPAARAHFVSLLGIEPYFDEPFYVGFSVGGYELGLNTGRPVEKGPAAYWGVDDAVAELQRLLDSGATLDEPLEEFAGGLKLATVILPHGLGTFGIIENPEFVAT